MMAHDKSLPDSPREALGNYILELQGVYYPWYERSAKRLQWAWGIAQSIAVLAGVVASVVAATVRDESLAREPWVRSALVVLPFLGSVASALLAQTRVRELSNLRESGREEMQRLLSEAKVKYAAASDAASASAAHQELVQSVSDLEKRQYVSFFAVAPGGAPITHHPGAPDANATRG